MWLGVGICAPDKEKRQEAEAEGLRGSGLGAKGGTAVESVHFNELPCLRYSPFHSPALPCPSRPSLACPGLAGAVLDAGIAVELQLLA